MEKMDGKTMDIVAENVGKLKELFPEAFTEGKVDFEAFKEVLGTFVDDRDERYSFTWNGKSKARMIAQTPSTGTLRPCKEESVDWDSTQNIFIEGDNLEVLKLLQKSYHKKVKMIYIDPPYNTGKDFVYKDNFKDNIKNYKEITGQVDGEGRNLSNNPETSGRYHTDWLNMMYPRLKLARNLLKDDGVIFISIDENEVGNLEKIISEIFGEENCLGSLPVVMNLKGNQDAFGFAETHEYIVVATKNKDTCLMNHFPLDDEELDDWSEDDYGLYKKADTLRRTGQDASRASRPKGWFPVFIDNTDHVYVTENDLPKDSEDIVLYPINESGEELSWSWGKQKISNKPYNLIVVNGRSGKNIYKKQRPSLGDLPTKKPKSLFYKPEYSTSTATTALKNLLEKKLFDGPKPVPFIKDLLLIGTCSNDLILDFFAGSATSAHAVMKLNAEDNGNRKFIMVQLPEATEVKSEAYKAGFKTIAEISKERIRRSAAKIKEENPEYNGDLGFKVFKLDSTNIKPWEVDFEMTERTLEDFISNIKTDRREEDVLYEILLKYGLDLTLPIDEWIMDNGKLIMKEKSNSQLSTVNSQLSTVNSQLSTVNSQLVYSIGRGALIICLSDDISLEVVQGIAKLKDKLNPEIMRVVFKDSGFKDDVVKTNAVQILKQAGIVDVRSL